ncbi:helix-turn-helix domain-containing protein [Desulforamulus ruminis]
MREKNGISRSALSRKSGVALSFINDIERGPSLTNFWFFL